MGLGDRLRLRAALGRKYRRLSLSLPARVDSTNARLKGLARDRKISPPYLMIAGQQTAGRGRLGRSFLSPPGTGLYMSLLVRPESMEEPGRLTILAAVAVCRAIEEATGLQPRIKWVNDLFLRGKKICGILAEGAGECAVVGIGVNLKTPPGGFPEELTIAGALDAGADRMRLAGLIARYFLEGMETPGDPAILQAYRERMPLIGREILYTRNGQKKSARVTGVAEDGGLMVETEGKSEILRSAEISLGSQSFAGLE